MRELFNIINPVAGGGKREKAEQIAAKLGGKIYYTADEFDIERSVINQLNKNPHTHFIIYGGDGSVNCCVNGIMKSGHSDTACFTAISLGSGNDFLYYMNEEYLRERGDNGDEVLLDVIEADGRYSLNILNTGFDCTVVSVTNKFRKKHNILGGKFSYTYGVLTTFIKKKTFRSNIELTYADGTTETINDDIILMALGNCRYYGGGYKVTPFAEPDDGLIDVVIARDLSRIQFLTLLATYKSGKHVVPDSMDGKSAKVIKKFSKILSYHRCKSVTYDTAGELCYDGEIYESGRVTATVCRQAVRYVPMQLKSEKVTAGVNSVNNATPAAAL
ncbi:MAG: hypothetical protein IJ499_02645 [Clostridia bacterium]|nr:hypothetical protein [Clostridia bacterium]